MSPRSGSKKICHFNFLYLFIGDNYEVRVIEIHRIKEKVYCVQNSRPFLFNGGGRVKLLTLKYRIGISFSTRIN